MSAQDYDSSVSGYLTDGFEGISSIFTEVEILHRHEHYTLARAKRYGRWWMLKAIKEEVAGQTIYQQMLRKEFDILMVEHKALEIYDYKMMVLPKYRFSFH